MLRGRAENLFAEMWKNTKIWTPFLAKEKSKKINPQKKHKHSFLTFSQKFDIRQFQAKCFEVQTFSRNVLISISYILDVLVQLHPT